VSTLDFHPGLVPPPLAGTPLVVFVRGLEVVVEHVEDGPRLPDDPGLAALADSPVYLGQWGERPCFAAPLPPGTTLPAHLRLIPGRVLAAAWPPGLAGLVGLAIALVEWETSHRFCGGCASATEPVPGERAKRCPRCAAVFYPRIAPAVIVLVAREREILLARGPTFPARWFSLLAGFVEVGETLEAAAVREVREEAGIAIHDLRYGGSQPWPFGRSLMVGFFARYAGGDLRVDGVEIAEAAWFPLDRLPDLPPPISIARQMVDRFVADPPR
jgi:NAD+ diphosphatase